MALMPRARKHLVCLSDTPYYHITSRCVRRAFLCGVDKDTGNSYEHRRGWIEHRIRVLSSLFSVHICAYAIMSNHYHLVVKLSPDETADWTSAEVLERWTALFKGPLLVQRYRDGETLQQAELDTVESMIAVYRARLGNLSWFMKCLNEPIARQANAEDRCTGHFWEARFHSQSLRSKQALLSAMAYVDLNPIRARIAKTPEESDYTSIQARLQAPNGRNALRVAISGMIDDEELNHFTAPLRPLMPFTDSDGDDVLPIQERDYLELVDCTGRVVHPDKRGRMEPRIEPILDRLGLSTEHWINVSTRFRQHYRAGDLRLKKTD